MKLSTDGVSKLRDREGCKLTAYRDTRGIWTIGVGHTASSGQPIPCAGMTITQDEADEILSKDVRPIENTINRVVEIDLQFYQFDALVSIGFNIGWNNLANSTIVKRLNDGDIDGASDAIMMWNKPPEIIGRRQSEQAQFDGD